MDMRKVQEMGGGTLLVSLPKEWTKKNSLVKGSILTFEEAQGGKLLIYPAGNEERESEQAIIEYNAKRMKHLVNMITGTYLLGVDTMKIQGKDRIKYDDRELIKKAIRQLVGLEIVEEDSKSITTQFLIESKSLDIRKMIRRMHMIAKGMFHDAVVSTIESDMHLSKVVTERDEEVDRLYFFLVRLIRSAAQDARLAARFKMTQIDCLDFRVATNLVEGIGDISVEMVKVIETLPLGDLDEKVKNIFISTSEILEEALDISLNGFLGGGIEEVRMVPDLIDRVSENLRLLETNFTSASPDLTRSLRGTSSAMDKISRYCRDLADLSGPIIIRKN